MKLRSLFVAGSVAAGLALAPAAQAATTGTAIVTGTTGAALALNVGVGASSTLADLTPGATSTNSSLLGVPVVSTGSWVLKVLDGNQGTSAAPGHLVAATPGVGACVGSTNSLAAPLKVTTSAAPLSSLTQTYSNIDIPATATAATIAEGTGIQTANVAYSQAVGASEQLRSGCAYTITAEYSVVAAS